MGKDAVDAARHSLGAAGIPDSITDRVPLAGAEGFETRVNQRAALARAARLHPARIDHLLGRYGDLVDEVPALVADEPDLAEPLEGAEDYLRAEVVYAVTHEGARHLDDVLPGAPGSPSRPSTGACTQRVRRRADGAGGRLGHGAAR